MRTCSSLYYRRAETPPLTYYLLLFARDLRTLHLGDPELIRDLAFNGESTEYELARGEGLTTVTATELFPNVKRNLTRPVLNLLFWMSGVLFFPSLPPSPPSPHK